VLDYRPTSLQEAAAAVDRIDGFLNKARERFGPGFGFVGGAFGASRETMDAFTAAMDDDLNVPRALGALHDTVRAGNTALAAGDDEAARNARHVVILMTRVLGLNAATQPTAAGGKEQAALQVLVDGQLAARAQARAKKDWAASDAIRDALKAAGVVVEDGPDGATWSLQRD
jgi:cysteinyl-tRNA synthetase